MTTGEHSRPHTRRRRHSSGALSERRSAGASDSWSGSRGGGSASLGVAGWLYLLTDLALAAALLGTTVWFGGRTPVGQLFLVSVALLAAGCLSAAALLDGEKRWLWTGSEWLWGTALAVVVLQVVELPLEWLNAISPRTHDLLPLWGASPPGNPVTAHWGTLSLSPAGTIKGLKLFAAYGLLFLTLVQRLRTGADVSRMLQLVAAASMAWAAFGLLQYATSNGRYYWVFQHPYTSTSHYATGSFTNRNHYAQLLALGIGPLVWCVARSLLARSQGDADADPQTTGWVGSPLLWATGLVVTILAVAFSLSRGGFMAAGIAVVLSSLLVVRVVGTGNQWLSLAMFGLLAVTGVLGYSSFDRILLRASTVDDSGRLSIWKANLAVWQDFPWMGTGIGTHADAHLTRIDHIVHGHVFTHAEGSYYQVASETGMAGIAIAVLMIGLALSWPLRVLISTQASTDARSAAAGILGSLAAHLAHACADFVWYVPTCMVTVATLVACGFSLWRQQSTPTSRGAHAAGQRWIWGFSAAATAALALWMLPGLGQSAAAERHQFEYQWLTHQRALEIRHEDEAARAEWEVEKSRAALSAAKADPQNAQTRLLLSDAYVRMFNLRQQQQDPPLSLAELKDVVLSSGFASGAEARQWLQKATGKNFKLLELAWKHGREAVRLAPLQAPAYLTLMEMSFLHDPSGELESQLIDQAVKLRPTDPQVQFVVGKAAMLSGKREEGLEALSCAFRDCPPLRPRISAILVTAEKPETLLERLAPDMVSAGLLADAYQQTGDHESACRLWRRQIELAEEQTESETTSELRIEGWMTMYRAHWWMENPEEALRTLNRAIALYPQTAVFRTAAVELLVSQKRLGAALDHLRWLEARYPDNANYRQLLEQALREKGPLVERPTAGALTR